MADNIYDTIKNILKLHLLSISYVTTPNLFKSRKAIDTIIETI